MSNNSSPHFLVIKNRALGDSIIGLSTLAYIKTVFPDAKITYLLPDWITPLYKNVKCEADQVLPLRLKTIRDYFDNLKKLSSLNVDAIIELQQRGSSAFLARMLSILLRRPYYFHNHNLKCGNKVFDQGVNKSIIQRDLDGSWSALQFFSGKALPYPKFLSFPPFINVPKVEKRKEIVVGIVATRKSKMWPLYNFAMLIKMWQKLFPDYEFIIPISKSSIDQELKAKLEKFDLPATVKFVSVSLSELPMVVAKAMAYIGNDTGLKHLAVALDLPTVTLFGPEPPLEWHPYDAKKNPYFYRENLACRTIKHHYCGLSECDSSVCLTRIYPEDVLQKLRELLHI